LTQPEDVTVASDSVDSVNELVSLLTMGINDKTIASELDLSMRTLNRRVSELMSALGARSRFQAGWLAAFQHMTHDARASAGNRLGGAKAPRRKSAVKPD
jgi:Bacterial regulatory proteins, luxR family